MRLPNQSANSSSDFSYGPSRATVRRRGYTRLCQVDLAHLPLVGVLLSVEVRPRPHGRDQRLWRDSWTRTFTDPRLCVAVVDRLTFGGKIIETGTVSYWLAHARAPAHHRVPRGPSRGCQAGSGCVPPRRARRTTAASPSGVPGQCSRNGSSPTRRTTDRSTAATMIASSA